MFCFLKSVMSTNLINHLGAEMAEEEKNDAMALEGTDVGNQNGAQEPSSRTVEGHQSMVLEGTPMGQQNVTQEKYDVEDLRLFLEVIPLLICACLLS